ncbi:MAG TPA: nitronate monooxygenase family protein [Anaeromyxobacteraceae bacterium]|nr:nitronate monooxygenase family protein [Anaeromyxobacteraceae bacterium]
MTETPGRELARRLRSQLSLPIVGAPMFIVSRPELVVAQCTAGVLGAFPALNARPKEQLDEWLHRIREALDAYRRDHPGETVAPFAVNQIIHQSNDRLEHDLRLCEKHRVPVVITSLRAPGEVVQAVHGWGGVVLHDVISVRHAEKALQGGADALVLVCAGAGGHAGALSPFAFLAEVRRLFDGPVALAGAITTGRAVLAAEAMGADLAYMGTRFIATEEANALDGYKRMIVESKAADVVYTPYFTGVHGNYLRGSILAAGLDPDALPHADKTSMNFGSSKKTWKDIWGAGQGVGAIDRVLPVHQLVAQLKDEYRAAKAALAE